MDEENSESSDDSVVYISSDEESLSEAWESDYSTGAEEMVASIEQQSNLQPHANRRKNNDDGQFRRGNGYRPELSNAETVGHTRSRQSLK